MQNKKAVFMAPMMLIFAQFLSAFAQTAIPDSLPGKEEVSKEDDAKASSPRAPSSESEFSLAVGAGVIVSPRPYTGAQSRLFPIPSIELEYKGWFFRGIRGGYGVIRTDRFSANLYAQARFNGLEHDSSPFLEGMEDRKKSMDAGVEFIYRGRPLGFRINYLADALGRSKGQESTLLATSGIPLGRRGIVLGGIGPRWLSRNHVDYYYGVRENEASPARPSYSGKATWNLDINITAIVNLSSSWHLIAIMNREGFGAGIKDSPIVDRGSSYTFVTLLNYRF